MVCDVLIKTATWVLASLIVGIVLCLPSTVWSDQAPLGFQTQFRYDPLNRVDTIADARHGLTGFTYDPNGNLLTVTDANTHGTVYAYDTMDRLLTRTDALTRQESYQYDPDGNLTRFLDRKGQASAFTYDAVGRLTRVSDSAPGAGAIDFYYDALDRLVLEVTPQGAVAYTYDALGRRTTMTVAGQAPVTYQYDADSRLTQVAQGSLVVGLAYDAAGRRTSLTYPNGVTTTYTYDNANHVTTILYSGPGNRTIESLTYTYDAAGNRTSLNRANGTASLLPAAVASATYDAANEQTQFGSATLTYDANGNLTNDGTNTYTWDARNRLVGISGSVTASFSYDSLGRRISKTINGATASFLYDDIDIVQEISGGTVTATYLRSLNIDEMFGILRQDGVYFSIYDGLGSTLALTNQAASPVVQYSYEPFGATQSTNPAFVNPFQFTGRENDATGLYYYRSRYYSPPNYRFSKEDPFSGSYLIPTTLNRYVYALNDPISYTDPSGLLSPQAVATLGGAFFGGVGAATGAIAQGITPGSDPLAFAVITGVGALTGAAQGFILSLGPLVPSPAIVGSRIAALNNLVAQWITGRKPINVGSAVGAFIGGGIGATYRAAAQAAIRNGLGSAVPASIANALGSGLGTAGAVGFPLILSTIGGQIGTP